MTEYHEPQLEQSDDATSLEWAHPVILKIEDVFNRYTLDNMGVSIIQQVIPAGASGPMEDRIMLERDGEPLAYVKYTKVDDGTYLNVFGFKLVIQGKDSNDGTRVSVNFSLEDGKPPIIFVTETPDVILPQEVVRIMRIVDDSLDGLLTAWVTDSDKLGIRILDEGGRLLSDEKRKSYLEFLAKMFTYREPSASPYLDNV